MSKKLCKAAVDLADGRTLICDLPLDHDGPVHSDQGETWGDTDFALRDQPIE